MYESVSRANLAQSGCSKLGSAWRRALSGVLVASACFVLLGQSGCDNANKPIIIKGPSVQPVQDIRWGTMRAVHRVSIDAAKGDGREQVSVRGMVAVERPDRFRLQAIGPGGITLFDLIKVGGDVKVVQSMAGADSSLQQKVLLSIGADLSAMYDLEPVHPSHKKYVDLKVGELRIVENERTIRAQQFKEVQGQSLPTHIDIDNTALNYKVSIDVEQATLDDKLDPALFRMGK
ncbi:MAG: hypothetical protein JNM83_01010 [Myxococcales bacterium]|jgi:hypothetical protein|nr:hypothetical protein [Myxococcales bacterium]